jgi:hypothetical protein
MTRHAGADEAGEADVVDRWYVGLLITAGAVVALVVAGVVALELVASRSADVAPPPWHASLARMDDAIARGDLTTAAARWRDAHADARRRGHWEALLDLGDASRRLGRARGGDRTADAYARDAYLAGLLRARNVKSVDGVVRAAEAFAELGDREVVEECLRVAHALAARAADPAAIRRVKRFSDRWDARTLETERARVTH